MNQQELLPNFPECSGDGETNEEIKSSSKTTISNASRVRLEKAVRNQKEIYFESLDERIPEDHQVRRIWSFIESLDFNTFYREVRSIEHNPGRPAKDHKILLGLWLFAFSEGVNSGRHIEKLCNRDDAYRWLCGDVHLNYHTINDFRSCNEEKFDEFLGQCIGVMMHEGLIDVSRIEIDGTKVRAKAKGSSFRREPTIEDHLAAAREHIEIVKKENANHPDWSKKKKAARVRAQKDKVDKCERALAALEEIRSKKKESEKADARASITASEARVMRFGNGGGFLPAINVQLPKTLDHGAILGVVTSQDRNDAKGVENTIPEVEKHTGQTPDKVVTDSDFINYSQLEYADEKEIDLYGPNDESSDTNLKNNFIKENSTFNLEDRKLTCPEGKEFSLSKRQQETRKPETFIHTLKGQEDNCQGCCLLSKCRPNLNKKITFYFHTEKRKKLNNKFKKRVSTKRAKKLQKLRFSKELTNARIKEQINLKQFHVQEMPRIRSEMLLVAITFNLLLLETLRKKKYEKRRLNTS